MANVINAEAAPAEIADALHTAAQDLRQIKDDNDRTRSEFESADWSGLDQLAHAGSKIDAAYDGLLVLADKFGLADEVRQAYLANEMVGAKHTVTGSGHGDVTALPAPSMVNIVNIPQPEPTQPAESPEPKDLDDYDDDDEPEEPEIYTTCLECDEPLDQPTTRDEDAVHPDCDPDKPPKYWMGALTPNGKNIDHNQAEPYRRLKPLAEDVFDLVLEWEVPYGETFISFPDGSIVDAREWIERPENLELAGGRDQYAGRGEFDPGAPDRCWIGQSLPSGRMARPLARTYEDVADLAAHVCEKVFEQGRVVDIDRAERFTVMLPGGELVDAYDWAQRPETRRLAGYTPVEFDPSVPNRCWIGKTMPDGPVRKLATPYEDVADLAAHVCERVYEDSQDRLDKDSAAFTVMLPGGELVDAYEWAQRPETRRLAGYTPVEFDPSVPNRCWIGKTMPDGPIRKLATPYDDVGNLAAETCREVFDADRIHSRNPFTVMLPGGELVDAYDWAQQPATRRLAGRTTVRNRVQFTATATCPNCGTSTSCTAERIIQGEIGEQQMVGGVLSCDTCEKYLSAVPVPITLVDDASAAKNASPRLIGDIE